METAVSHLWELPTDVWSLIIEDYLTSNDIVLLKLTGSGAMWQKLTQQGVLQSLSLSTDFPNGPSPHRFLLGMPNLRHLKLVFSSPSPQTQKLLGATPPNLESLEVVWSPEHYGRRWPGWPPSVLPLNLLSFKSNLPIYDKDFGQLPRTLTSLELTRQESVDGSGFRDLPPGLTHLRLFITSDRTSMIHMHLTHLCRTLLSLELPYVSHVEEEFFSVLPPQLLRLNISRVHQISVSAIEKLPRTLTDLNIKAVSTLTNQCLLSLPPKLMHLCVQPNESVSLLTEEAVRFLPPTLTSYDELPRVLQREFTRLYLQNQIEGLEVSSTELPRWVACNLTDELVHLLPATLRSLDLTRNRFISEHGLLRVPIGLQRLYLPNGPDSPKWPGMLIKYLPRGLKDLDLPRIDQLDDSHLLSLPPQLTRLRFCVDAISSPLTSRSLQFLPPSLKLLELPLGFLQDIDINTVLFKLPTFCQQITFGAGPGSVTLRQDSNNSFLRDTLKHRYFTPKTIQWVFEEILKPLVSILGLVFVTHLLFNYKCFFSIPIAISIVPTICSSLLFVLQRYIDPDTSLFSWRPSTSVIIPQLIIFGCYSILYIFYETRRPWSPW
jgi:hypothetical protein